MEPKNSSEAIPLIFIGDETFMKIQRRTGVSQGITQVLGNARATNVKIDSGVSTWWPSHNHELRARRAKSLIQCKDQFQFGWTMALWGGRPTARHSLSLRSPYHTPNLGWNYGTPEAPQQTRYDYSFYRGILSKCAIEFFSLLYMSKKGLFLRVW